MTTTDTTLPPMPMVSAADILSLALSGSTVSQIVRQTGLATVVIENVLRAAKAPARHLSTTRGPQMSRRKFDHAAAAAAVADGDTQRFTARRLGVTENAIRAAVKQETGS